MTAAERAAGGPDGYANFFVRDPWFVVGDVVVEGTLRLPYRRREVLASRDILAERALGGRCTYVALPQPAVFDDWDRIEVTEQEGIDLATNELPIGPDVYITDPVFAAVGDRVAAHGVTVEYVDFAITRSFGGSFRCTTQSLWRE